MVALLLCQHAQVGFRGIMAGTVAGLEAYPQNVVGRLAVEDAHGNAEMTAEFQEGTAFTASEESGIRDGGTPGGNHLATGRRYPRIGA